VGVLTCFIGVVGLFPARIAYQWFAPAEAALSGISGTVWSGRARHADVGGVYLRDLSWRIKPLGIFRGGLSYGVEGSPAPGNLSADAVISIGGLLTLRNINGTVPLQAFDRAANMPGLQGRLTIQMDRLVLENGLPVAADGEIQVARLLAPLVHRSPIGGFRIEFFTQNSGVMASIEDTDGVVDLAGSLQVSNDRNYTFIGLVAPKATTPEKLRQQMQFLGTANERGQYELRLEGSL
jgi:hypothetical protein